MVLVPLLSDLDRYTLIHLHHKFLPGIHKLVCGCCLKNLVSPISCGMNASLKSMDEYCTRLLSGVVYSMIVVVCLLVSTASWRASQSCDVSDTGEGTQNRLSFRKVKYLCATHPRFSHGCYRRMENSAA